MSEQLFGSEAHDEAIEVLEGQLWYLPQPTGASRPVNTSFSSYVELPSSLQYERFFADFGPLHLGHTVTFMEFLDGILRSEARKKIYLFSPNHSHLLANTAVLLGIYQIVRLGKTAEEAYLPFFALKLPPFRDAVFAVCPYCLTVLDVLRGVSRAMAQGHIDFSKLDVEEYNHFSSIENGDLNWIVPGKFVAFSGPLAVRREIEPGKYTLTPEDYVPVFKQIGVNSVIRFNKKCYERNKFLEHGIRHYDLYYEDGANPTDAILQKFLEVCEKETGAIAVHCKAGLGRTGTNIGAYMMKHYQYTAAECIGWSRVCRPGMVNGPQQQYLECLEGRILGDSKPMTFQALQAMFSSVSEMGARPSSSPSPLHRRPGSAKPMPNRRSSFGRMEDDEQQELHDGNMGREKPRVLSPLPAGKNGNTGIAEQAGRKGTPGRRRPQSTNLSRNSNGASANRGRNGTPLPGRYDSSQNDGTNGTEKWAVANGVSIATGARDTRSPGRSRPSGQLDNISKGNGTNGTNGINGAVTSSVAQKKTYPQIQVKC